MLIVKQHGVGACVAVMVERTEGNIVTAIREDGDFCEYDVGNGSVTVYSAKNMLFIMEFKNDETD